ncbi:MAG: PQQ-binding-like beta-propeller repeat protein [Proteobacteria bacterium]|nr:PQQ-binding-like beta-propeller repeat protein [Pseudomonadota bacterium]
MTRRPSDRVVSLSVSVAALAAASGIQIERGRRAHEPESPGLTVEHGPAAMVDRKAPAVARDGPAQHALRCSATGCSIAPGRGPCRKPIEPVLRWRFETGGPVTASPALSPDGGSVYVGSHDGYLYALDRHGKRRWSRFLGGKVYSGALVGKNGHVFVGSDARALWSFSATGELRWRFRTAGEADTTPAQAPDGTLYFAAGASLYALGAQGRELWRLRVPAKIYSSPALGPDGTIYTGSQDDHLYAVDRAGRVRWRYRTRGDVDAAPLVGQHGNVYVGSDDDRLYALSADGRLRWAANLGGHVRARPALDAHGGVIASSFGPRATILSLDARLGRVRWHHRLPLAYSTEAGSRSGAVVGVRGSIYVGAHDHKLYAFDPHGRLRWTYRTAGRIDSTPTLGPDNALYFGTRGGAVYALTDSALRCEQASANERPPSP